MRQFRIETRRGTPSTQGNHRFLHRDLGANTVDEDHHPFIAPARGWMVGTTGHLPVVWGSDDRAESDNTDRDRADHVSDHCICARDDGVVQRPLLAGLVGSRDRSVRQDFGVTWEQLEPATHRRALFRRGLSHPLVKDVETSNAPHWSRRRSAVPIHPRKRLVMCDDLTQVLAGVNRVKYPTSLIKGAEPAEMVDHSTRSVTVGCRRRGVSSGPCRWHAHKYA